MPPTYQSTANLVTIEPLGRAIIFADGITEYLVFVQRVSAGWDFITPYAIYTPNEIALILEAE